MPITSHVVCCSVASRCTCAQVTSTSPRQCGSKHKLRIDQWVSLRTLSTTVNQESMMSHSPPTCHEKEQLFVPSVSFDAACILAAFDLPQLLIDSPCLAHLSTASASFIKREFFVYCITDSVCFDIILNDTCILRSVSSQLSNKYC